MCSAWDDQISGRGQGHLLDPVMADADCNREDVKAARGKMDSLLLAPRTLSWLASELAGFVGAKGGAVSDVGVGILSSDACVTRGSDVADLDIWQPHRHQPR